MICNFKTLTGTVVLFALFIGIMCYSGYMKSHTFTLAGDEQIQPVAGTVNVTIPYEANKDVRALDFETHFQYTFYIINRLLSCYTTLIEKQNSMGRADIIIESDADIYIFEFKLDGSAKESLEQIDDRQYALPYLSDKRKLHKIGVNISSKKRTVEDWISI